MLHRRLNTPPINGTLPPGNVSPPPPDGANPNYIPASDFSYSSGRLSPLFFTAVIAGFVLVILLIVFLIYALRRSGLLPLPHMVLSPEEEADLRRREERARMRRLRCGVPPWVLQTFPVYVYGSPEFEAAMKQLHKQVVAGGANTGVADYLKESAPCCQAAQREAALHCSESWGCSSGLSEAKEHSSQCCDQPGPGCCDGAETDSITKGTGDGGGHLRQADIEAGLDRKQQCAAQEDVAVQVNDGLFEQRLAESGRSVAAPPGKSRECSVCLAEFEAGEVVRLLPPCGHVFHRDCVNEWLALHRTCPVCRCCVMPAEKEAPLAAALQGEEQAAEGRGSLLRQMQQRQRQGQREQQPQEGAGHRPCAAATAAPGSGGGMV